VKDWKLYVLGVLAAVTVTIAGNWSSSRIDVLDQRARALESDATEQREKLRGLDAIAVTLARIEQKVTDLATRMQRVEQKLDAEPRRGRGR